MSNIYQKQVQKQLQKLSPQQIQMIKLLELPAMQLEQRVKQEIEENPVLEEEQIEDKGDEETPPKEISVDEYMKEDDTPSYKLHANNYSKDDKQRPVYLSSGLTLHEYLVEQLGFKSLAPKQAAIAKYLIGSIDDDGYLRRDLESISDDIAFSMGIETSCDELEKVLKIVHELEPAGIGARSLKECLLLQLDSKGRLNRSQRIARKIIVSYFDEFTKKHYDKLIARMGVDEQDFREAVDEIKRLSPKPGNLYSGGDGDVSPYIMPDFVLDYQNGQFDLRLNSYSIPEIKISKRYVEMIRKLSVEGDSEGDKEALKFVKNKIDSARWFISAVKQRHDTLMSTMREILNYQRDYFVDGNQSRLRPMILKDIADRTGLDVSTISRVVNSKYIQTHFGVLSLKQLFSEAMQTDSGEEVSSYEIKNILSECIKGEDKLKPLTDEALMDILNGMGYHIARRTVAKYREMLGIPVARLRKQI